MKYKVATYQDWPEITVLLASTGYYYPIDASTLGGQFVIARSRSGEVVGCVWAFHGSGHAFVDFYAVRPGYGRVAAKLLAALTKLLRGAGVKHVRMTIKTDNIPAQRMADAFDVQLENGYTLGYKRLDHGN